MKHTQWIFQCFNFIVKKKKSLKYIFLSALEPNMRLCLWCVWTSWILTVHTAAQHLADREEGGVQPGWRRQSAGTPTPLRPDASKPAAVRGTGEKLGNRRAALNGWVETNTEARLYVSNSLSAVCKFTPDYILWTWLNQCIILFYLKLNNEMWCFPSVKFLRFSGSII